MEEACLDSSGFSFMGTLQNACSSLAFEPCLENF